MNINLELISNLLTILIALGFIVLFVYLIFKALFIPVKMNDALIKEKDKVKKELEQIQLEKVNEWEQYKQLMEENDKMRKAYFALKEDQAKLKENMAKLSQDKENLQTALSVAKKSNAKATKKEAVKETKS